MNTNEFYKNYIYFCRTALLLAIYVIFFPFISTPIKKLFPSFGSCTYLKLTGKPCPLCGGTRYIENLGQAINNWQYLLHPFGLIVIFIIFEIIFRLILLHIYKKRKEVKYNLIILDILIHSIVAIMFISYEIIFIMLQR